LVSITSYRETKMEFKKFEELLMRLQLDSSNLKEDVVKMNLKKELSSIDFLKFIMLIEDEYNVEFSEEKLKMDVIDFAAINEWIKNEKR